jgi:hypothetical protein
MGFARDRDIAVVEPSVYRELVWMGQVMSRGECLCYGTTLEATGLPTPDFVDGGVQPGNVVLVGGSVGATFEVMSVAASNVLAISRLRALAEEGAAAVMETKQATPYVIATFQPQLEWVHGQLLEMLGLRRNSVNDPTRLAASRIKNADELTRLEVYGALQLIYAGAAGLTSAAPQMMAKATYWRGVFQDERQRVVARIDADGDGVADVVRRFNVGQLVR